MLVNEIRIKTIESDDDDDDDDDVHVVVVNDKISIE